MHSAIQDPGNINIVKFFLSQDVCKPMLLSAWKRSASSGLFLPLDLVNNKLVRIGTVHNLRLSLPSLANIILL